MTMALICLKLFGDYYLFNKIKLCRLTDISAI